MDVVDLSRPGGLEPPIPDLKMQGIERTNCTELHRFVILQHVYKNSLKTRLPKFLNRTI